MIADLVGYPRNELPNIAMQQTNLNYPKNYVPTNQQNYNNQWKLASRNKYDSTVWY